MIHAMGWHRLGLRIGELFPVAGREETDGAEIFIGQNVAEIVFETCWLPRLASGDARALSFREVVRFMVAPRNSGIEVATARFSAPSSGPLLPESTYEPAFLSACLS